MSTSSRHSPPYRRRGALAVLASLTGAALAVPGAAAQAAPAQAPELARMVVSVPAGTAFSDVREAVGVAGGRVVQQMPSVRALVVDLPSGAALPDGVIVAPDRPLRTTAGTSDSPSSVTSTLRETVGATPAAAGAGVTVAVLDTGVADVPDLADAVVGHVNVSDGPDGDGYGHGTFMAGLIAGNGAASDGAHAGVAPQAKILDVQVANRDGETSLSKVLAGVEAVARHSATDPTLRVLNLSLSSGSPLPPSLDPLAIALNRLWHRGIVVVVSAGNDGPDRGTISSPGNDPLLLTVGALDEEGTGSRHDDTVAEFSARGGGGFGGAKPDLVAPGTLVVSVRAPGSLADVNTPPSAAGPGYLRGSGSSMGAAVTSGAVAAVLSARPELSADQVKRLFVHTAYDGSGLTDRLAAGSGGVSVSDALIAKAWPSARAEAPGAASRLGPAERDAQAWAAFASAWAGSSSADVAAAWAALSPQTQRWASNAWAADVAVQSLGLDDAEFSARAWSARAWSADGWSARAWSARAWSSQEWLARAWSARAWSGDAWSARAWSARAWSARAWSEHEWESWLWSARAWSARAWSARAWSAQSWGSTVPLPLGEESTSR